MGTAAAVCPSMTYSSEVESGAPVSTRLSLQYTTEHVPSSDMGCRTQVRRTFVAGGNELVSVGCLRSQQKPSIFFFLSFFSPCPIAARESVCNHPTICASG